MVSIIMIMYQSGILWAAYTLNGELQQEVPQRRLHVCLLSF